MKGTLILFSAIGVIFLVTMLYSFLDKMGATYTTYFIIGGAAGSLITNLINSIIGWTKK